jgi:hypothetical protein
MGARKRDDELIVQLASGKTMEDAARAAGMSRMTVFRRLAEQEFRQRVTEARGEFIRQVAGQLAAGAKEAASTLLMLMNSGNQRIQLLAAKNVLEQAVRTHDLMVLEARVAELEKIVGQKRSRK